MVEKLRLPFPLLSDPDRSGSIEPFGVADPNDPRGIARPAMILLDADGVEHFRFVSRDYADRLPEDDVVAAAQALGLGPVTQSPPAPGVAEPGPRALVFEDMAVYFRGAKFAARAMGMRHSHLGDEIKEDSIAFGATMDRYVEAAKDLYRRRRDEAC